MIEFFEFLNTCSAIRTITYLLFIIISLFIGFAGIADIIKRLRGDVNNHFYYYNDNKIEDVVNDNSEETNGQSWKN